MKFIKIPDNIILLFQPPYCKGLSPEPHSGACKPRPEVNPIEREWEHIKYYLRSLWFIDLNDVKDKVASILNSLEEKTVVLKM
jgi:hypothetical protein